MSKLLKRVLVILIILMGIILFIPKLEKAVTVNDSRIIYGTFRYDKFGFPYERPISDLNDWKNFELEVHSAIMFQKFIFCLEEEQHLPSAVSDDKRNDAETFKCNWKVTIKNDRVYQQKYNGTETELTGANANFTKGLAYIVSNMDDLSAPELPRPTDPEDPFFKSEEYLKNTSYIEDAMESGYEIERVRVKFLQREIWSYIHQVGISDRAAWFGTELINNNLDYHSELSSSQREIVNDAIAIAKGESNIKIKEAEFYVLQDSKNAWQTLIIVRKATPEMGFNFNFTKKSGKNNSTLKGATVDIKVSGTKKQDGIYRSDVYNTGSFSISNMELANPNGSIEITIKETAAPTGYKLDTTEFYFNIKYNYSTKKWYIANSKNTYYNLFGNTLSGNTLTTSLINIPDIPHNPGPGQSSDKDTSNKETTKFTGKVWVKGQNGDKDIKVNASTSNIFNSGIDTPLSGVNVNLSAKAVQYQPVYGYRYYKYVWVSDGYYDANAKWIDTSFWDYEKTVYYNNPLSNYNSNEYRSETKLIRDYVAISSKNMNEFATTNGLGEYTFSTDLTTYEWTYNGKSHLISEYIENGGTVTFKYNGVSYVQVAPAVSYTQNTSSNIYSNATESTRGTFNNKFKTVNLSNVVAAGAYADFSGGKSVLNIPANGVKNGNAAYQIPANTMLNQIGTSSSKVSARTIRVNLGLLTREIDVSLSTRGR